MDSGIAAVLGAVIGVVGSGVGDVDSTRFSTPPWSLAGRAAFLDLDSIRGIGNGFGPRFGNTARLAPIGPGESLLMPACLHDHRDLTAIIGNLRVELR